MEVTDIDDVKFQAGAERISELTGRNDASSRALLAAYLQGVVDLALDQVAGVGAIPTSLTVLRADMFRWVCARADRIVSEREAEVLLRTTSATARSVLTTMRAMYEDALRELFLGRMREDAVVRPSGNEEDGLTWTIEFTENSLFDLALAEIRRLPIPPQEVQSVVSRRRIEVPRGTGSSGVDTLGELGIVRPPSES